MIVIKQKGDFSKFTRYLERVKGVFDISILDKYGKIGVDALSSATPIDSGLTSNSWFYKVVRDKDSARIEFGNSNIKDGVPIAIILQYGHATGTGGWVEGRDYINPAIQPVFDKIADDAWKEVVRL